MATGIGKIFETRLDTGGMSGVLACPSSVQPDPGQYVLAFPQERDNILPVVLFPASLPGSQMTFAAPFPQDWTAGMRLTMRGPLGKGFRMPVNARRVALCALGPSCGALLPVAARAFQRGAEVVLYADLIPGGLPAQMEVLPLDLLPEAAAWADYLALDIDLQEQSLLRDRLKLKSRQDLHCPGEVLVRTPMPCAGSAKCGVCSVPTQMGWKYACKDGPVFSLADLIV